MPTQEQYEAGLKFMNELANKQYAEGKDDLLKFTEWVINQTVMAMNQMDLFNDT